MASREQSSHVGWSRSKLAKMAASDADDSRLPPELWKMVVEYLPREDQRRLLFVCKFFRDLAIASLFSHITVCFGLWRPDASDYDLVSDETDTPRPPMTVDQHAEMLRVFSNACEILHHIAHTPSFARLVKMLSVRAYFVHHRDGTFELFALKEALLAMTHVTSFRWDGHYPLPNAALLDALAQSSGHSLRELYLPSSNETWTGLTKFHRIQTLTLHRPYDPELLLLLPDDSLDVSVSEGMEANQSTLTCLTLYGDTIWRCPVRSLLGLQELEIILPPSLAGLELVLRHCTALRYVTLDLQLCTNSQFLELFKAHPDCLPHLTAFKLFFEHIHPLTIAQATLLADFLRRKKTLRMLDLADSEADMEEGTEVTLLMILPELPALEVLGLNVQRFDFWKEDLEFLGTHLPPQLSALFLNLTMDAPQNWDSWVCDPIMLTLMFLQMSKLRSLRYLHIIDVLDCVDLKQQLLEYHPDSLELVGHNTQLRWLENDPEQDILPRYSPGWSTEKVRLCTVEHFGCRDWEWLFRYHALRGPWNTDYLWV
ncbi:hypothetical protein C8T65DRAFT_670064 [Cerioporus squamosus]|nr:hypothetical protein C8T65DRAFT_670064 [Cerioporus squamosus]